MKYSKKLIVSIGAVVVMAFFISGCAGGMFSKKSENGQAGPMAKSRKTTAVYYDFEDVLIPAELSIVNDRTFIVSTPGVTSGIITLKGRVDKRSLFNFFSNNMQKDNWNVTGQIKSPGTTILVYQKSSRTAVITLRDEQVYTYVEVGVSPTVVGETGSSEQPGLSESTLTE